MIIAVVIQNVIVIVVVALAVLLMGRQFYRLATGKSTKCSCCPGCKPGDKNQCDINDKTTPPGE